MCIIGICDGSGIIRVDENGEVEYCDCIALSGKAHHMTDDDFRGNASKTTKK